MKKTDANLKVELYAQINQYNSTELMSYNPYAGGVILTKFDKFRMQFPTVEFPEDKIFCINFSSKPPTDTYYVPCNIFHELIHVNRYTYVPVLLTLDIGEPHDKNGNRLSYREYDYESGESFEINGELATSLMPFVLEGHGVKFSFGGGVCWSNQYGGGYDREFTEEEGVFYISIKTGFDESVYDPIASDFR